MSTESLPRQPRCSRAPIDARDGASGMGLGPSAGPSSLRGAHEEVWLPLNCQFAKPFDRFALGIGRHASESEAYFPKDAATAKKFG